MTLEQRRPPFVGRYRRRNSRSLHATAACRWRAQWRAEPGEHELSCRATDANGMLQPLEPVWDISGFGNNAVQRVRVAVR